jgi:hypothetical protein
VGQVGANRGERRLLPALDPASRALLRRIVDGAPDLSTTASLNGDEGLLTALLPLVAAGFRGEGLGQPTGTTAVAHEETSTRNTTLLDTWDRLAGELGAPCALVGDLALAAGTYGDLGLRPVRTAELLVPIDAAGAALERLADAGWQLEGPLPPEDLLAAADGAGLVNPTEPQAHVRLVWHAVVDDHRPAGDAGLLDRRRPLSGRSNLSVPAPVDQLVVVAARAATEAHPRLQWRLDVAALRSDGLSLDEVVEVARARRLSWTVGAALDTVAAELDDTELQATAATLLADTGDRALRWYARHRLRPTWGPLDRPARFAARHRAVVTAGRPPFGTIGPHHRVAGADLGPDWRSTQQMNSQVARRQVVRRMARELPVRWAVETGTFRGATTVFLAETLGCEVWTVEVDPRSAELVRRRLATRDDIHLHEGDSRSLLRELAPRLGSDRTFFYLDAHWEDDLPLWGELDLIFDHWTDPLVLIDDFAVPDDPGYGYDDYGPGKVLDHEHLVPHVPAGYACWWPEVAAQDEAGGRRGSVLIARQEHAARLATCLLRPSEG